MKPLKLLLLSSIFVTLSGCAYLQQAYDAYFMAGYDNVEYGLINKIRTNSELAQNDCGDYALSKRNMGIVYKQSLEFKNFTQYIPDNKETVKLSEKVFEIAKQGVELYDKNTSVSLAFCKLKFKQINGAAETAQKVMGSKPR